MNKTERQAAIVEALQGGPLKFADICVRVSGTKAEIMHEVYALEKAGTIRVHDSIAIPRLWELVAESQSHAASELESQDQPADDEQGA